MIKGRNGKGKERENVSEERILTRAEKSREGRINMKKEGEEVKAG